MTFDDLIEQSCQSGLMAAFSTAREACAPWDVNHLALLAPLPPAAQPRPLPAPPASVRGMEIARWQVYPATFLELLESLDACPDRKRWATQRVAEQVTGLMANGTEVALSVADVRAMPMATGKALTQGVTLLGDAPCAGKPEVTQKGDGVSKPLTLSLGQPIGPHAVLTFQCATVGELEDVAAGGTLIERLEALFDLTKAPSALELMVPADGWALIEHVLNPITKAAQKAIKGIRSYEYVLKMQFGRDTSLRVVHARQVDFGAMHDKKIKAQEAAAAKARRRR